MCMVRHISILIIFFLSMFGYAIAASGCNSTGRLMIYGGCNIGQKGLVGLFAGTKAIDQSAGFSDNGSLVQPYAPVETPQSEITLPIDEIEKPLRQSPKVTKRSKPLKNNSQPHQLPVYMGDTSLLVFRSENKQLSKHGPDTQAILMLRCKDGNLNVLLDFPGYPMSDTRGRKTIDYKVDQKSPGRVQFSSSDQMSVIGIWKSKDARKFAKKLFSGKNVLIAAKDTENTSIKAQFSIENQRGHTSGFGQACGIA